MEVLFVVSTETAKGIRRRKPAIGPSDRRLLKSRCIHCARAHRKCSGEAVCSTCTRLSQDCVYPKSRQEVDIPKERAAYRCVQYRTGTRDQIPLLHALQNTASSAVEHFFQRFLPSNNFSAQASTCMYDIHLYSQSCPQVYHATIAIGALSIRRHMSAANTSWSRLAYESYEDSLKALRIHLQAEKSPPNLLQDLWTIVLLGIFELMEDRTGQGFLQHINLGLAQVVEQLGPAFFQHGLAKRFFLEIRLLEVCKSILLSQPSLFSQQHWRDLAKCIWETEDERQWQPMEALVDIMTCISEFVIRAIRAAETASSQDNAPITVLRLLSHEAQQLFDNLQEWISNAARHGSALPEDDVVLLGSLYYSACSVYLSSPFDYFTIWQTCNITTPALSQSEVDGHVEIIISSTKQLLQTRRIAGVLLLFPLRIAGSRSRYDLSPIRRNEIEHLLGQIQKTYAVAEAITGDLNSLWDSYAVQHTMNNHP